jgi:hypothetical protein
VSTPEEFLAQQAALSAMTTQMAPFYELIATLKRGFVEEGGLGPDAADLLVVEWVRKYVLTAIPAKPA